MAFLLRQKDKTRPGERQQFVFPGRRLNWTQLELARRVGITESLVTKIETGRATPEQPLKDAIARELNIHTWEVGL